MNIEGLQIGQGHPCRTVAEISCNHNGSFERALRLITAAKDAGADFVKFQAYSPDELVALRGDGPAPAQWGEQGYTMSSLYQKARTPFEWFPDLFAYARDLELVPFSSVFGHESLEVLKSVDNPCYKVAKLDNQHSWLVDAAIATGKPVIVSADGRADHDVHLSVSSLYCPGSYPCAIEDVHLPRDFAYGGFLGLSSHCTDPVVAIAAVARGAKLLEYHFQLDDEPGELEKDVSLYASEFAEMVDAVRVTELVLS